MGSESKRLRFDEHFIERLVRDEMAAAAASPPPLRGVAVFRDPRGNVLMTRKNLIVHRGRTFVLESLFKDKHIVDDIDPDLEGPTAGPFVRNLDRSVYLFGIGTGGADADPFTPDIVNATDDALDEAVPFRVVPTGTSLGSPDDTYYYGMTTEAGEDKYWYKRLNINSSFLPEWEVDLSTPVISMKMTLDIGQDDAREKGINELGLYLAEKVTGGSPDPDFDDVELFSRITFATEMLQGSKEITIEYYIFA